MLKQHSIFIAGFGQSDECLRTQVKLSVLMSYTFDFHSLNCTDQNHKACIGKVCSKAIFINDYQVYKASGFGFSW